MKLVLCARPWAIGSVLLRAIMWSKWSHSAIYDPSTQQVYHATLWRGVHKTPAAEFFGLYTSIKFQEIRVLHYDDAVSWLELQVGKKYDWTALLSWVVRREWDEPDSWFCSELTEAFRTLFERRRFSVRASRITPQHQDMVI